MSNRLSKSQKRALERFITISVEYQHWVKFDDLVHRARILADYQDNVDYFSEKDFKNAVRRLERRGTLLSRVQRRGWYKWKEYSYFLPF